MKLLTDFPGLVDLRGELATAPQHIIGTQPEKTSATVHFNGPALQFYPNPAHERAQLLWDAPFHINKVWGYRGDGSPIYGDGIMYHFGILSNGTVCQLRDLDAVLYHCSNPTGNARSVSITFVLGEGQRPTAAAWAALERLLQRLYVVFSMIGRKAMLGHTEWPKFVTVNKRLKQVANSVCPGPVIMPMIEDYRAGRCVVSCVPPVVGKKIVRYRVNVRLGANVRTGPARMFPKAMNGTAAFPFGYVFESDGMNRDEQTGEQAAWVHVAPAPGEKHGLGFVHVSIVERA